jgi:hypothetical protein
MNQVMLFGVVDIVLFSLSCLGLGFALGVIAACAWRLPR